MCMYKLLCFVDGMLVGTIASSVIPRIGESIYVDNMEDSLLNNQTWDVLHVNYAYQDVDNVDSLNQIAITLIESKTVDGSGTLSFSVRKSI